MTAGDPCPLHPGAPCPRWCGWHSEPPHDRAGRTDSDPMMIAACAFVLVAALLLLGVTLLALAL